MSVEIRWSSVNMPLSKARMEWEGMVGEGGIFGEGIEFTGEDDLEIVLGDAGYVIEHKGEYGNGKYAGQNSSGESLRYHIGLPGNEEQVGSLGISIENSSKDSQSSA